MNRFLKFVPVFFAFVATLGMADISPDDVKVTESKVKKLSSDVLPAVVSLIPAGRSPKGGAGSGVIVSEDGLILTAAHVTVEMGELVTVIFPNGNRAAGRVLGMDFSRDSAMVQILDEGPYPFVEIGESKDLKENAWCISLGHAGGFQTDRSPPVRLGRVVKNEDDKFLTSDCTLIGGDSGGPLFDLEGKLIGIHSNIGFSLSENRHVPISAYLNDWDRLKSGEEWGGTHVGGFLANPERPVMGAALGDDKDKPGALVKSVIPRSPADLGGLKAGDRIVMHKGDKIENAKALMDIVNTMAPGDRLLMTVEGATGERGIMVKLIAANQLRVPRSMVRPKQTPKAPSAPKVEGKKVDPKELQKKFSKRMRESLDKNKLKPFNPEEIKEFGGQGKIGAMTREFAKGLSDADHQKFIELVGGQLPARPANLDPDALIPVGEDFFRDVMNAYHPSVARASESTHLVFQGTTLKSLCTVVHEDGYVLTKLSELEKKNNAKINVMIAKGKLIPAKIVGEYSTHDLALLKLDGGPKLIPAQWHPSTEPMALGTFIAAAGSGPDPIAIGVVSVQSRSLTGENKGFLGISTAAHSKGVRVAGTVPGGAARAGGMKVNDIIKKIDGNVCETPEKVTRAISEMAPGTKVKIDYLRNGEPGSVEVTLADRGKLDANKPERNGKTNTFGTQVSKRSSGYANVMQNDLPITPQHCGGPVVDLDGNIIGINIARAGRIKTYTMPASEVIALLNQELPKILNPDLPAEKESEKETEEQTTVNAD